MRYYSTNKNTPEVTLKEAVIKGLAADKGLFMPEKIKKFDTAFFADINKYDFREISLKVASSFFEEEIESENLREIVFDTLQFDCPVIKVSDQIYSLELFHGPTLAFKDIGARFMARLLRYFLHDNEQRVNVLVATSGDTGSAVANGFLGVEGIHVFVLYPEGKVSRIQESQFTTLGQNITALEVRGTFDDCQRLVKSAFLDDELNSKMLLTSANSINVARFLPQTFYYFNAYARLKKAGVLDGKDLIISVPSGNFGNLTAGLFARKMGLPVKHFLAANNANDVVYKYLKTGSYKPVNSVETLANAMDVGDPSNFARILDLYDNSHHKISKIIKGFRYYDDQIKATIKKVYSQYGYICDPHGACGYQAMEDYISTNQAGVFLETAHPAKFKETVESVVGDGIVEMPERLKSFLKADKQSVPMKSDFNKFKRFLLSYGKV